MRVSFKKNAELSSKECPKSRRIGTKFDCFACEQAVPFKETPQVGSLSKIMDKISGMSSLERRAIEDCHGNKLKWPAHIERKS